MKRLILALTLAGVTSAPAYELRTHALMTATAFEKSRLGTDATLLSGLGLDANDALGERFFRSPYDASPIKASPFERQFMPDPSDASLMKGG